MADNTINNDIEDYKHDDDDVTAIQEYVIAGLVIGLFGLLYWFINHGWTSGSQVITIAEPSAPHVATTRSADFSQQSDVNPYIVETARPAPVDIKKPTPQPVVAKEATVNTTKVAGAAIATTAAVATPVLEKSLPETESVEAETPPVAESEATSEKEEAPKVEIMEESEAQEEAEPETPTALRDDELTYTLPNGKEVKISDEGFEKSLKDAIESNQVNAPLVFDNIHFNSGSATINSKSNHQIEATAALLHKHPDTKILLRGHTDNTGFPANNIQLSMARANAMGIALGRMGIDTQRIRVTAMGDSTPVASNSTEEGREKNRRIEVLILE